MITLRFVYLISVNPGLKHLESKGLKVQKDTWDLGDMMEIWWRYDEIWWRYGGDMMEIWWRYDGDMMEVWWRYDGDMMEIWWRYDGDMMEIWWRYDGDMMEIWWRYGGDMMRYDGDMMEIWWRYDGDMMRYDGDMMEIWCRSSVSKDLKYSAEVVWTDCVSGKKVWSWTWRSKWRHNCKLIKCQSIHNVTKIYIWIKLYSFEGCVHKWIPFLGGFHGFHKIILNWTSVFNFSNNKCFFSCKSSYQNDIWRIMWYWRRVWC